MNKSNGYFHLISNGNRLNLAIGITVGLSLGITIGSLAGVSSLSSATYILSNFLTKKKDNLIDNNNKIDNNNDNNIEYPDEIKEELLSRVKTFFGDESFDKLKTSFVIVVGLGGVGSHATNMLVRSGVSKVRLIDFDQVTLSSLNRHAVASMEDVGISKAITLKNKLLKVVPWCDITAITEMFKGSSADRLLDGNPDFVLDCIDDVNTKAELIAYCSKNNIKVLTSMGAGGKADPTRLRISALSDCINDPLATKIKWKLKKYDVSSDDVVSIFSIEKPICDLLPLNEEQANAPADYGVVDYVRLRVMPVLGTSPSIFGQAMASYVLCQLANKAYQPEVCERLSRSLKHKIVQAFRNTEKRRFNTPGEDIDIDDNDIEFVVQQVWKNKCAVTGRRFGGTKTLIITRWDPTKPATLDNIVLILQPLAIKIEEEGIDALVSVEDQERVRNRLIWAANILKEDEINLNNESLSIYGRNKYRNRLDIDMNNVLYMKDNIATVTFASLMLSTIFSLGYFIGNYKINK